MGKVFPNDCGDCQHLIALQQDNENNMCCCGLLRLKVDLCGSWVYGYKCPLEEKNDELGK